MTRYYLDRDDPLYVSELIPEDDERPRFWGTLVSVPDSLVRRFARAAAEWEAVQEELDRLEAETEARQ